MGHMAEDPDNTSGPEPRDDEYPVLPPDPEHVDRRPSFDPVDLDELLDSEASDREPWQFSLAEMLMLMLVAALFLGIVSYLPGGYAVKNLAGIAGLGLVLFRIALDSLRPERTILYVAWWLTLVLYLGTCALAVVMAL